MESPFAAVLVLWIFPFRLDAGFEEVVIGFEGEFGGRTDVVLATVSIRLSLDGGEIEREAENLRRCPRILRPSQMR